MKRFKLENSEGGFTTLYQQSHGKDTSMDGMYSMAGSNNAFCFTTNGIDGSLPQSHEKDTSIESYITPASETGSSLTACSNDGSMHQGN